MKTRTKKRGRNAFPPLPCGCKWGVQMSGYLSVIILKDGSRVCRCGRRWKLSWVEIKK